jgi:hypothetical protein
MELELIVTIAVVSLVASILAGLLSAAVVRERPLAMLVVSQLIGTVLIAFVSSF